MLQPLHKLEPQEAKQLWSSLAEEGKAPVELNFARLVLPSFTVAIDPWIDRIAKTYLCGLSRQYPHFKLVIAGYGGGKTHFLMSLGSRALAENFAVSYVACTQGINIDSPLAVYRAVIKSLQLPGEDRPGLNRFLHAVVRKKRKDIGAAGAPDPEAALDHWVKAISQDDYPENAFGRVIAEALRGTIDQARPTSGDAAKRWLLGDIDTLTKEELANLRLAKVPSKAHAELGRNLLLSMVRFSREAGVGGTLILFDEVETLLTLKGKALDRVLSAMRVMLDIPNSVPGGLPLLGVFATTSEIHEQMKRYMALEQRLSVRGASFSEGNDYAPQLPLEEVATQEKLLSELGHKLIDLGEIATGHSYDKALQAKNVDTLAEIAAFRDLEINARRIYVKTCVNILEQQTHRGEREYADEELKDRYQGSFGLLKAKEQDGYEA